MDKIKNLRRKVNQNFKMKIVVAENGFGGGHYAEKFWFWDYMEAHHLAKYKRMNFNSLIPESEERLVRKFFSN